MRMMKWLWLGIFSVLLIGCQAVSPPTDTPVGWNWSYRAGDYIRSQPVVAGNVAYIGSDDNDVHVIGIYTGASLWQYRTDDNVTALAVDDSGVYFGSWDGAIYALDNWGKLRWQYETDGWVSAAPVLQQGVLYVGSHDGAFYALSAANGELLWRYQTNGPIEAQAALAGDRVLISSSDGYVHALETESGQRKWYYRTGGDVITPPVLADGRLYIGSLDGSFYALDSATGELRWRFAAKGAVASAPAVAAGMVFVAADDGQLYALEAENGAVVWQRPTDGLIRSALAVWEDWVFAGTDSGTLYAFDRRSGMPTWRYQVGGMITAGPTIADDRLYVGSTARQVQAFVLANGESRLVQGTSGEEPALNPVQPVQSSAPDVDLESQWPQLEEYGRLWAARAAMPSIDAIRTLQDVIAFRPHSPAAYEAHLMLARYYAQHSEPAAEEAYRAALAIEDDPALRLELARYLEAQRNRADAYTEYQLLLEQRPDAFAGMRRTGSDPLTVARDFNQVAYFSDALETLRDVDEPGVWTLRGRALLGLRRYEESYSAYQRAVDADPNNEDARLGLAMAAAWLGRSEEALAHYRKIDTPESRRNRAQLLAEEEPEEALALYRASSSPNDWWSATAILESQGRLTETLPLYARMAVTETRYADDAAYRLVVLGRRLGDAEVERQGEQLLAEHEPNWLAYRSRGGELHLPLSAPLAPDTTLLAKVRMLEAMGRDDLALRELAAKARASATPEVDLAMAQALAARGEIRAAQQIAEEYIREHDAAPQAFWALSYPRPYSETVTAAAAEFDVDPMLIWAVMREESRFAPDARSWADARGLMQFILPTQEWVAGMLDLDLAPGDAYVPETSIRMAAKLLSFLIEYFDGDVDRAILAYNAGSGSVEYWQAEPQVANHDDLLRWIGYDETRLYLKRVGLSHAIYRTLYGAE